MRRIATIVVLERQNYRVGRLVAARVVDGVVVVGGLAVAMVEIDRCRLSCWLAR